MSHSAGFSYGSGQSPVHAMYQQKKPLQSANLHEMVEKLASIPLNYQPSKGWLYSVGMDIEGYLVEKLSGQTLPDFMRDHIFEPLGMKDTIAVEVLATSNEAGGCTGAGGSPTCINLAALPGTTF